MDIYINVLNFYIDSNKLISFWTIIFIFIFAFFSFLIFAFSTLAHLFSVLSFHHYFYFNLILQNSKHIIKARNRNS